MDDWPKINNRVDNENRKRNVLFEYDTTTIILLYYAVARKDRQVSHQDQRIIL
jgi:hypothetical protein